jgi:hypothetical protein
MPSKTKSLIKLAQLVRNLAHEEESTRIHAIGQLKDLGSVAKSACLAVIACLADDAESVRYRACQLLSDWYPGIADIKGLSSEQEQVRLAAMREVITLLPDVQAAIASHHVGWQALGRLTGTAGQQSVRDAKSKAASRPQAQSVMGGPDGEVPERQATAPY